MTITTRVRRLESYHTRRQREALARWLACDLGMPVERVRVELREVEQLVGRYRHLVIPAGPGLVDLEPSLRAMAADVDLDPEALIEEAQRLLAEWEEARR